MYWGLYSHWDVRVVLKNQPHLKFFNGMHAHNAYCIHTENIFFYLRESLINKVFHFINWLCKKKSLIFPIFYELNKNILEKILGWNGCTCITVTAQSRPSSMVKGFQSTPLPNRRKSSRPVSVNKRWVTHVVVSGCTIHITRVYV